VDKILVIWELIKLIVLIIILKIKKVKIFRGLQKISVRVEMTILTIKIHNEIFNLILIILKFFIV
jgi:hypothetical protein